VEWTIQRWFHLCWSLHILHLPMMDFLVET
jgi:hypothetical protein